MKTEASKKIKSKRLEKGLGLREFAKQIEISPSYLSMWESGTLTKDPSQKVISKMEEVLGLESGTVLPFTNSGASAYGVMLFKTNAENSDKVREFLDTSSKKKISGKAWDKILNIVKAKE